MGEQTTKAPGINRAKTYQLVLFPLNNGATNVYYVLVLSYIATFGSNVLALGLLFCLGHGHRHASVRRHYRPHYRRSDGPHQRPFGKFRPFMVLGNLIMAVSILLLYAATPLIPAHMMGLRYAAFRTSVRRVGHRLYLPDQLHPLWSDRTDQRPLAASAVHHLQHGGQPDGYGSDAVLCPHPGKALPGAATLTLVSTVCWPPSAS